MIEQASNHEQHQGLPEAEAQKRLAQYGLNQLPKEKGHLPPGDPAEPVQEPAGVYHPDRRAGFAAGARDGGFFHHHGRGGDRRRSGLCAGIPGPAHL